MWTALLALALLAPSGQAAPAQAEMKRLGKSYEPHVYDGAGHGFLRQQDGRNGANWKATKDAWPRTVAFLREHLK
jgi:dienelactone hydrolase